MQTLSVRQASFGGGEIAPALWGRTDLSRYPIALRQALNWFIGQQGSLLNRSGTKFVHDVKTSANAAPRLIPFIFSSSESYVLEFGDLYMRVHRNGATVTDGAGAPYQITTPYAIADVRRLKYAQVGNTMTIVHPSYAPSELVRIAANNWTLTTISWSPLPFTSFETAPLGYTVIGPNNRALQLFSGDSVGVWNAGTPYGPGVVVQYPAAGPTWMNNSGGASTGVQPIYGSSVWVLQTWGTTTAYGPGNYVYYKNNLYLAILSSLGVQPTATSGEWVLAADALRPAKPWKWLLTLTYEDTSGGLHETLASAPITVPDVSGTWAGLGIPTSVPLYTDRVFGFTWPNPIDPGFQYTPVSWNVFRGKEDVYGFVGSTDGFARSFLDIGDVPDYTQQPPKGTDPFVIKDKTGAITGHNYPGVVSLYEQRRIFARSNAAPQTLWFSDTGNFYGFDTPFTLLDSSSFDATISSLQYDEIRSMVPLRSLMLMTQGGEYALGGSSGTPLTPSTVDVHTHQRRGSSYLDPLVIGNTIIHAQEKGNSVCEFTFDTLQQSYKGVELSLLAQHLFPTTTDLGSVDLFAAHVVHSGGISYAQNIVDWAYAAVPYSIAWMVRSDGVLLGLTYNKEQEVVAWHHHTTDGFFESVCVVPEQGGDAVYFVVRRVVNGATRRIIERLSARQPQATDQRFACFLDCAQSFDNRNTNLANNMTVIATFLQPDGSTQATVSSTIASFNSGMVGSDLVLFVDTAPVRGKIVVFTDTTHVTIELYQPPPTGFVGSVTANWSLPQVTYTLDSALALKNVYALADGEVLGPYTVTGGNQVTLEVPAVIATIGLQYNSDCEFLDILVPQQEAHTRFKNVSRATLEVQDTRGLFVGRDASHLRELQQRDTVQGYAAIPLFTGRLDIGVSQMSDKGGSLFVRQSKPLPAVILALTREVTLGGN